MPSAAIRPWFHRLIGAIPGPPPAAAFATTVVFAAVGALVFALDARLGGSVGSPYTLFDGAAALAVLAAILWAGWYVLEGFMDDLRALEPSARCGPAEFAELMDELGRFPRLGLAIATLAGPLVPLSYLASGVLGGEQTAGFRGVFLFVVLVVDWLVLGPVLYVAALAVARMWRLGWKRVRVDLLDPGALSPFARFGLRLALLLNVGGGLLVANSVIDQPEYRFLWLGIFAPVALLGLAALIVPSWSVHRCIRQAKAAELSRVRAALHGDRTALRDSPLALEGDRLSVVELVQWRDYIAAQREWPFDAAALRRFGLYLLIPLASWVGAALVERLVDRLI